RGVSRPCFGFPPPPGAWPPSLPPAIIGGLLRQRLGFSGLVVSDDLEMGAVVHSWGVAGAARRFLGAGGDLALVCRGADARRATAEALAQDVQRGVLDLAPAVRRRQAARRLIESGGPRPDVSVIGCTEHRALAEEVARLAAARG